MHRDGSATSPVRWVVPIVVVELTLVTAYLHISLGGQLFLLNGLGYLTLAAAYLAAPLVPLPPVERLAWLPRIGLAVYALVTIGAYLVMGPFTWVGWVAKGIEVAIVALLIADLVGTYRTPDRLWHTMIGSVPFRPRGPGSPRP
jgi:hypothetical protein